MAKANRTEVSKKSANLAVTLLTSAERAAVTKLRTVELSLRTAAAIVAAQFAILFPSKASVRNWDHYKRVMLAIKQECGDNSQILRQARLWLTVNYGGIPNANGVIQTKAVRAKTKASGKGWTIGRFGNAMDAKLSSVIKSIESIPSDKIEPAILAELAELVAAVTKAQEQLAEYVAAEKEAAEAEKAA